MIRFPFENLNHLSSSHLQHAQQDPKLHNTVITADKTIANPDINECSFFGLHIANPALPLSWRAQLTYV